MDPGTTPGGGKSTSANTPHGSNSRGKWSVEEDNNLRNAVEQHSAKNWKKISEMLQGRTDVQCLHRWQKVLKPGLVKGPWTKEEDEKVVNLVKQHGMKSWSLIARQFSGRLGKQCRERWYNHLNPDIVKTAWTDEEDQKIIEVILCKNLLSSVSFIVCLCPVKIKHSSNT